MATHWKKLMNPDYLGSYAFEAGEEKLVTIDMVTRETVTGPEGRKSDRPVLHFRQQGIKPMILNYTNARKIEKLTGTPDIEKWGGQSIVLVVRPVKAFGEYVDGLQVKMEKVAGVCTQCGRRVVAAGEMSASQVVKYTRDKFGAVLCADCVKKHSKGPGGHQDNAQTASGAEAGNQPGEKENG